jgi:hypothetical protein
VVIASNESLKTTLVSGDTQRLFFKGAPDAVLFVKLSNLVQ